MQTRLLLKEVKTRFKRQMKACYLLDLYALMLIPVLSFSYVVYRGSMKSIMAYIKSLIFLIIIVVGVSLPWNSYATRLPEFTGVSSECYSVIRAKQCNVDQSSSSKYTSFELCTWLALPSWESLQEEVIGSCDKKSLVVKTNYVDKAIVISEVLRCLKIGDISNLKYILKVFVNNKQFYDQFVCLISETFNIPDMRKLSTTCARCFVPIKTLEDGVKTEVKSSDQFSSIGDANCIKLEEEVKEVVACKKLQNREFCELVENQLTEIGENRDDLEVSVYCSLYCINELLKVKCSVKFYDTCESNSQGCKPIKLENKQLIVQLFLQKQTEMKMFFLNNAFTTSLTDDEKFKHGKPNQTFHLIIKKLCDQIIQKLEEIQKEGSGLSVEKAGYWEECNFKWMKSQILGISNYKNWREYLYVLDGEENILIKLEARKKKEKLYWQNEEMLNDQIIPNFLSWDRTLAVQFFIREIGRLYDTFSKLFKYNYCRDLISPSEVEDSVELEAEGSSLESGNLHAPNPRSWRYVKSKEESVEKNNVTMDTSEFLVTDNITHLSPANTVPYQIDMMEKYLFDSTLMPSLEEGGSSHHIGGASSNSQYKDDQSTIKSKAAIEAEADILHLMYKATLETENEKRDETKEENRKRGFFVYKLADELVCLFLEDLENGGKNGIYYSGSEDKQAFTKELKKALINFFNWKFLVDRVFDEHYDGAKVILRPQTCQEYIATLTNKVIFGYVAPAGVDVAQCAEAAGVDGDYNRCMVLTAWRDKVLKIIAQYWWELMGVVFTYTNYANPDLSKEEAKSKLKDFVLQGFSIGKDKNLKEQETQEKNSIVPKGVDCANNKDNESIRRQLLTVSHKFIASLYMSELKQPPKPIKRASLDNIKTLAMKKGLIQSSCDQEVFLDYAAYFLSDFIQAVLGEGYKNIDSNNLYHGAMFPMRTMSNFKKTVTCNVVGYSDKIRSWNNQVGRLDLDNKVQSYIRCREILGICWNEMSKETDCYGGIQAHKIIGFIAHVCKADSFAMFRMRSNKAQPFVYIGKHFQHPLIAAFAYTFFNIPDGIYYEEWRQCYALANMFLNPFHSRLYGIYDNQIENLMSDIHSENIKNCESSDKLFDMQEVDVKYFNHYGICHTRMHMESTDDVKLTKLLWIDRVKGAISILAKDQLLGYLLAEVYKKGGYSDCVELADLIGLEWNYINVKEILSQ